MAHMKASAYYCDICKKYFEKKKRLIDHATLMHPGVPILSTNIEEVNQDSHSNHIVYSQTTESLTHQISEQNADAPTTASGKSQSVLSHALAVAEMPSRDLL